MTPTAIGVWSLVAGAAFFLMVGRTLPTGNANISVSCELRIRRDERPVFFWFFTACYAAMGTLSVANAIASLRQVT